MLNIGANIKNRNQILKIETKSNKMVPNIKNRDQIY